MTPEWAYTGGTNLHGENEVMSCGKLRLKNGCWNYDMVLWSYAQQKKNSLKWLDKNHIRFGTGSASDHLRFWNSHREDTCYYIKKGHNLLYGPTSSAYEGEYREYTRCTFYGLETSEFESADDKEMCDFLGF